MHNLRLMRSPAALLRVSPKPAASTFGSFATQPSINSLGQQQRARISGLFDFPKNIVYAPVRNPDTFQTYLSQSASTRTPLITLWTASYCSSCRTIEPLIRFMIETQKIGEAEGGVAYAPIEFDSPDIMGASVGDNLAMTYMITSVPTLLSFDAGEAQTKTKVVDGRQLSDREFLKEWIKTEARRHGDRGGGSGGLSLGGMSFGGLFGSKS